MLFGSRVLASVLCGFVGAFVISTVDDLIDALEKHRGKKVRGWSVSQDWFREVNVRSLIFESGAVDYDRMEQLAEGEDFVYLS